MTAPRYSSSNLRLCEARRSGCGRAYPETDFRVKRDGRWLATAICYRCIARQNVAANRKQKRVEFRCFKAAQLPLQHQDSGDSLEFLLRRSIAEAQKRKDVAESSNDSSDSGGNGTGGSVL